MENFILSMLRVNLIVITDNNSKCLKVIKRVIIMDNRIFHLKTRELPGDALVNISNEQNFTGNGSTFIYSEISK